VTDHEFLGGSYCAPCGQERNAHVDPEPERFGPSREGSPRCQSGSLASGGTKTFCTCDVCF
jgi:hypothetical protein